jgi:transposase InsO family protein
MCRVLEVSTSGFFAWQARAQAPRSDADAPLRQAIVQIHQSSRRRYGRRRLTHALRVRGWCVNPKRVRRVMREEGLRGVRQGRFVPRTTDSAHQRAIAPNVLHRRFGVDTAVHAWASDLTDIAAREGWLYRAVVIALQTRQGLGYSLSDRMPDERVRNACNLEVPPSGTLFHSDRGSQYASDDCRAALGALGMVASMSRKRNGWDNAVSESFFATLKTEEATEP